MKVAALQAEPVWLDLDATVDKTVSLIHEAGLNGAQLLAFPEVWIPGYPYYIWVHRFAENLERMTQYVSNSLCVKSTHMARIQGACKEAGIYVSLGFAERVGESIYMAQALIDSAGEIVNKRHKMMPTGLERLVYGNATENCLYNVTATPLGRIGHLQCWEHLQPLLKFHTISQGEQIHVAAWPGIFPHLGFEPFSMTDEGCTIISQTYAMEAQTFVVMSTSLVSAKNAAAVGLDFNSSQAPVGTFFLPPGGGRADVFGPDGRKLTETVAAEEEAIVYADINVAMCSQAKLLADPVGHYVRPDLLRLVANTIPPELVSSRSAAPGTAVQPVAPREESVSSTA